MKLMFKAELAATWDSVKANMEHAKGLCLPDFADIPKAKKKRLAIIGGGPSINHRVNTLRHWDGDIWAINGAAKWCDSRKIRDYALFSLDPTELLAQRVEGCQAKRAFLATQCHPATYHALRNAEVVTFDLGEDGLKSLSRALGQDWTSGAWSMAQSSTASAVTPIAIALGYQEITFFGCEGSYSAKSSHAYMSERDHERLEFVVLCNNKRFLTRPDYYMQAQELAEHMRNYPMIMKQKSGGLLEAMIADDHDDVVGASPEVIKGFKWDEKVEEAHIMGVTELMSKEYRALIEAA